MLPLPRPAPAPQAPPSPATKTRTEHRAGQGQEHSSLPGGTLPSLLQEVGEEKVWGPPWRTVLTWRDASPGSEGRAAGL